MSGRSKKSVIVCIVAVVSLVVGVLTLVTQKASAATFIPKDSATIHVVTDGTHDGVGTESYVRSEFGFDPADDTANDGVVTSGDIVTYQVNFTFAAGAKRTVRVAFSDIAPNGVEPALTLASFSQFNLGDFWLERDVG